MNEKWEYVVIGLPEPRQAIGDLEKQPQQHQAILNELGINGWELIAVTPTTGWDGHGIASFSKAYFKRQMR